MKELLAACFFFLLIASTLSSCRKCAVCVLAGQESNKMCRSDDARIYSQSKKICESSGGQWLEK